VERSSARAREAERAAVVEQQFLAAVIDGANSQGFVSNGSDITDGVTELRFDDDHGLQLVINVGTIRDTDTSKLRDSTVPLGVALRAASYGGGSSSGSGSHGDVVVVLDEWSGEATASISLLLGLDDYVDEGLSVDIGAVSRDVGATVAVVRSRLT
jgi:hypothetical protein